MDDFHAVARRQILDVAGEILEQEGPQAVSTRSVAKAAGIRAASLYSLFGDKDGLLAALAVHAFGLYLAEKHTLQPTDDPVADMRRGWDMHVDFGLRHPALYMLMFGPKQPGRRPPAAAEAHDLLLKFIDRIAAAGRLRTPPDLAAHLSMAACTGAVLTLIGLPPKHRDLSISTRTRDTLIDSLITDPPEAEQNPTLAAQALSLDAAVTAAASLPLRPSETALLHDWLHQLATPS